MLVMPKPTTTFINVAGKKTQLTVGGEGPPLLYLHSAGGETDWMPFHNRLAKSFTVYAPAHPGFALSEGLAEVRDIYDYAWHYVDLMEQLGLRGAPVVGFSLGAWLAAEIAIVRPHLVSKLVLVNAAGVRVEGAPMGELFTDSFEKMRQLLFYDPTSPVVAQAIPTSIDDSRILQWLRAREATARVGWNPYLHNPRLPQHLRRVECPALILWGREDRLLPLACGQRYAELIPRAELQVIEQCGHMLPFEQVDEFVDRTVNFIGHP
jgi:pimeloyl-ACP methyl ester carboxylesterase